MEANIYLCIVASVGISTNKQDSPSIEAFGS